MRSKKQTALVVVALITVLSGIATAMLFLQHTQTSRASSAPMHLDCSTGRVTCTEVHDSEQAFGEGHYVGHDEPSTLFYSNTPGSGNQMQYSLVLPKDPAPAPLTAGTAFNFQLHPAFWFGMAMCDTQSYPEQLSGCTPDDDHNIVNPAISPRHPGTAFMEMQFYPPGWVSWPAGVSCDAKQWCAALNIDSYSFNPVTGLPNNTTCLTAAGIEPVNFAFITKTGIAQAPASPLLATMATFTPDPTLDLFMNSGDHLTVNLHDTSAGLQISIDDLTAHQSGSMTASSANGFGQVKFAPNAKTCTNLPYNFHPMYNTSSEKTIVPWAAHSYNIAFADEIGHFDFCNGAGAVSFGDTCPAGNTEGLRHDQEATDADDTTCFPATASTLVQVTGCIGSNTGFDGLAYQPVWPDGNIRLHPTPIKFSSPLTGSSYTTNYDRVAFEADLPRIEFTSGTCDRHSGLGCTLIPLTDDAEPGAFYPFFSTTISTTHNCLWQLGNHIPGSNNDFGQNAQYGTLLQSTYTGPGGTPFTRFNNYRQIFSTNPCQA